MLPQLKSHLNISTAEDDAVLQHYLDAARDLIEATTIEDAHGTPPVDLAILMTAANFYAYRESLSPNGVSEIPDTLEALLAPYRTHGF